MNSLQKQAIYLDIRNKILNEYFKPGDWLSERDLAQHYGVSRTPVREVLRMLAEDGLIESANNRGYFVKRMTLEDVIHVYICREAIEPVASRLACERINPSFEEDLLRLQEKLTEVDIRKDPAEGVRLGRQLHDIIVDNCGNPILKRFYERLVLLSNMTRNITKRSVEIEEQSREAHLTIIEKLLKRKPEEVEDEMRKHIRSTYLLILEKKYSLFQKSNQ